MYIREARKARNRERKTKIRRIRTITKRR